MNKLRNILASVFVAIAAFAFFTATPKAEAKPGLTITIYVGERPSCKGFGICRIDIDFSLRTVSQSGTTDGSVTIKTEAELQGKFMRIQFKDKPDKQFMNSKGQYIFPIEEDIKLSEKDAAQFGCSSLTIKKGEYRLLPNNELKLKVDAIAIKQR